MAAFLNGWVFATHSLRSGLPGQVVSFSPLRLHAENERVKRCDY